MTYKTKSITITGAIIIIIMAIAMVVPFPFTPTDTAPQISFVHLPASSKIVARCHDERRDVVYYTLDERLFCLDKTRQSINEIIMANQYDYIEQVFIDPENSRLFVVLNCKHFSYCNVLDLKQLWMINTYNNNYRKLAEGFSVRHEKDYIIVSRGEYCLNSNTRKALRRWIMKDHYIDYNGKALWTSSPYKINEP